MRHGEDTSTGNHRTKRHLKESTHYWLMQKDSLSKALENRNRYERICLDFGLDGLMTQIVWYMPLMTITSLLFPVDITIDLSTRNNETGSKRGQ